MTTSSRSVLLLSFVCVGGSAACTFSPGEETDAATAEQAAVTGGDDETLGEPSGDPFNETPCSGDDIVDSLRPFWNKRIRAEWHLRRRSCSVSEGCREWERVEEFYGAGLSGIVTPSDRSNQYRSFLRFEGAARGGRKLQQDWMLGYGSERGRLHAGLDRHHDVYEEHDGSWTRAEVDDDGPPQLVGSRVGARGNVRARCFDAHVRHGRPFVGTRYASTWTEWEAAMKTTW